MNIGQFHAGTLFFAVVPDADTAAHIHRLGGVLKCAHQFEGQRIGPACLHVTLFFLGDAERLPAPLVRMACEAAAEVRTPAFEVWFDRSASFRGKPGHHPFVLLGDSGLGRLKSLRQSLGAAMVRNGLKPWANTDFNPHVTLLYDARNVEEQPIEPVGWTVGEFVLVHSRRGHAYAARWPLDIR